MKRPILNSFLGIIVPPSTASACLELPTSLDTRLLFLGVVVLCGLHKTEAGPIDLGLQLTEVRTGDAECRSDSCCASVLCTVRFVSFPPLLQFSPAKRHADGPTPRNAGGSPLETHLQVPFTRNVYRRIYPGAVWWVPYQAVDGPHDATRCPSWSG